ncbi:MAG: hypothetical protein WCF85_02605 [Rhodospirillaceae bacterium]
MDIDSPGAALMLRQGGDMQQVSLSQIKRQAKADAAVVTMATDLVKSMPSNPALGRTLDTTA